MKQVELGALRAVFLTVCVYLGLLIAGCCPPAEAGSPSALSDQPKPMLTEAQVNALQKEDHSITLSNKAKPLITKKNEPEATPPIFEWGDPFLKPGNIAPGFTLPTGAVWQPGLWIFGGMRTTGGYYDGHVVNGSAYATSTLNLFANLKLSGTERILLGINPLTVGPEDTGVVHRKSTGTQFANGLNFKVNTLFFEGDFGEIFPNLDPNDNKGLDYGFSIGRQPILFQDGVMFNDTIDALGVTRDTIIIPGLTPDMRVTGLFGFSNVNRANNAHDGSAYIFGIFTETDTAISTFDVDLAYIASSFPAGGDGVFLGVSSTQRIEDINTTFSVNSSFATGNKGPAMDNGTLLLSQVSATVTGSENIIYGDAFLGIGNYTSAARDAKTGGPLGRVGILFAAPAVGTAGPALSNQAGHVVGAAVGYQMFFNDDLTQVTVELGGRKDTNGNKQDAVALGGQWLHALDNRTSIQVDGFLSGRRHGGFGSGLRMELRTRF